MNTTLPPDRDVPPHRRAQIRSTLEHEVARRRSVRFAPLIAAGFATAAVIALVAVVAPWQAQDGVDTAAATTSPSSEATTAAPASTPSATAPVIPGLSPERIAEIEKGCADSTLLQGKATLYQHFTDEVGTLALLYTDSQQLSCVVDGPAMPYNASSGMVWDAAWLPGALALDELGSGSGGADGKAEYAGQAGYDVASGRVTGQVAKVVLRVDGQSAEARIANGTFVARIAHPADWVAPEGRERAAEVMAYDAAGGLLGTWRNDWDPGKCWVRPDGVIVAGARDLDPATCLPAVPWR